MNLNALHQIALVYDSIGDLDNAETTIRELINARIYVQGESHPDLAASYYIYAGILKNNNRYQQAIYYNEKAVEVLTTQPEILEGLPVYLKGLANLYHLFGNSEQAFSTYHKAAHTCSEVYSSVSRECALMYQVIGEFFLEENQIDDARVYLQQAYDGFHETMNHDQLAKLEELLESVSIPVAGHRNN